MGYSIQKLIDTVREEHGYVEKKKNCPTSNLYEKVGRYAGSDNWTKYWKDLANLGLPNYQGSYYCIAAIFWAMVKCYGLPAAQKLCRQTFMINCQVTHDKFKPAGRVYSTPKIGDIVVFWNGKRFHHAELVVEVKGDSVKTFGANTSAVTSVTVANGGGCRYGKNYSLKAMQAAGHKFLRPEYGEQNVEGWVKDGDNWKYQLSDASFVTNTWKYIKDRYYAFDKDGYMIRGWYNYKGQWYYLCQDGAMAEGWKQIDGYWYFLDKTGEMHTGWLQDGDSWYYLRESGAMKTGWKEIGGQWYYFSDNGKMLSNTWFKDREKWYYFSSTGAMYKSKWKQHENGKWYYLTADGYMATNSFVKDELTETYYFVGSDGVWEQDKTQKFDYPVVI